MRVIGSITGVEAIVVCVVYELGMVAEAACIECFSAENVEDSVTADGNAEFAAHYKTTGQSVWTTCSAILSCLNTIDSTRTKSRASRTRWTGSPGALRC